MSDIDGLYSADPRLDPEAYIIPEVFEITDELREIRHRNRFGVRYRRNDNKDCRLPGYAVMPE
jgi:hypothetical protein